jgi:micrococcal nuclease
MPTKSYIWAYIFGITMLVVGVKIILMSNSYWIDGEWRLTFSKPLSSEASDLDHSQYGPSIGMWRTFAGLLILGGVLTLYKKLWTRYVVSVVVILFLGMIFAGSAYAKTTYGNLTVTTLVEVYDGDTFRVDIGGLHPIIGANIRVRIRGVDTPEIKKYKCEKEKELGMEAKAFIEERLNGATKIQLLNIGRGNWFRIVADVIYDGKSIAPEIIQAGHGVVYHPKKKKDWCAEAQTD